MATGVKVEHTQVINVPGTGNVALGTGQHTTIPAQLVLVSIGYRSKHLEGVAFDQARGVVPNVSGRVLREQGGSELERGLYVCGWLKRGPSGALRWNGRRAAALAALALLPRAERELGRDASCCPVRPEAQPS